MAFTCPRCGRTSHHRDDEREGYCGACHDWTGAGWSYQEDESGSAVILSGGSQVRLDGAAMDHLAEVLLCDRYGLAPADARAVIEGRNRGSAREAGSG